MTHQQPMAEALQAQLAECRAELARQAAEIEQLARQAQARAMELDSLLALLPVGIGIAYDPACRRIRVNPALAQMIGISPDVNASLSAGEGERPTNFRVLVDGRELAPEELPMQVAAGEGREIRDLEAEVVRTDGQRLTLLEYAVPLYDANGLVSGSVGAFVDITARRQAERAQEAARLQAESLAAQQTAILRSMTEGLTIADPQGNILDVNQAGLKALGFARLEDARGFFKRYTEFLSVTDLAGRPVPPEEWPLARAMRGESFTDHELIVRRQDTGQESVQSYGGAPVRDASGRIVLAVNTFRDITVQKRVEADLRQTTAALREARDRLELEAEILETRIAQRTAELSAAVARLGEQAELLNLTHDAIFVRDLDGTIRFWNRGATQLYGWETEQSLGQHSHLLLQTDFPEPYEQIMAELEAGGRWEGELQHTRRDGTRIVVESRWSAQWDASRRLIGILETNTDITARKRALQALHENESRFRVALDGSPITVFEHDCDLRYTWIYNPSPVFGRTAEEVIGRSDNELVPPEVASQLIATKRRLLNAGRRAREEIVLDIAGQQAAYDFSVEPLHDAQGRLTGMACAAADITHRKQIEDALRHSREQLQAFSRRLVEVQENERRTIARELHDEAGQTLTVLKLGLAQLLKMEPAERPARIEELRSLADGVMDSLHRLVVSLRPISLDRHGLTIALTQLARSLREQGGVEVTFTAEGLDERRLPPVIETTVYRVVQEALTNIARHAGATQVAILVRLEVNRLSVIIEDNGRGFDPVAAQARGRLGLTGMQERAEMLGGHLTIEASPGAGTTVYLAVPYHHADPG